MTPDDSGDSGRAVPPWLLQFRRDAERINFSTVSQDRKLIGTLNESGVRQDKEAVGSRSLTAISRHIDDACTLAEAVYWHSAMTEHLVLRIIGARARGLKPSHDTILLLRQKQRWHMDIIRYLRELIAKGDILTWP